MSTNVEMNYDAAPKFGPIYKGILLGRRKGYRGGQPWPAMKSTWKGAKADLAKLSAYRGVTGWPDDGTLPLLYPHVLSSPLHLGMFAHPAFPLSPLGGVHARNVIIRQRAIQQDEALDFVCTMKAPRIMKQGLELDVNTEARAGGQVVWESSSTYLFRGKFGEADAGYEAPRLDDLGTETKAASWTVPVYMGRRYAKICGDFNPIHISKILAKLFGFKRDLIHGMWSAARALVETGATAQSPVRFDVIFKGPIWIGANTSMKLRGNDGTNRFDLYCQGNERPCLNGLLRPAAEGETI